jgi:pyruvate/2-oxoglutarate/acetoin dehydrogenase E1 component
MSYHSELCVAMELLAQDPRCVFVGQGVGNAGTTMSGTFDGVPAAQRIEFPVAEDLQMGFCTGLSLAGQVPICVFPRWNFLLCAANQLVNHLDRIALYSGYQPKVIIRVATPSRYPFYPGPQHDDSFYTAFRLMLRNVNMVNLLHPESIVPEYRKALNSPVSTILCESTDYYKKEIAKERS